MKRGATLAAGAALALAGSLAFAQDAAGSLEYPIKAAFLYRFGSFVDWPASAFAGKGGSITLCVVGRDPFGPVLERTVQGKTIGARSVAVRRLATVSPAAGCHIAYLGGSSEQSVGEAARALARSPVLTVTDGAANEGRGAIHFVGQENRGRFRIDLRAAAAAGVTISSKLLNLAVEVAR